MLQCREPGSCEFHEKLEPELRFPSSVTQLIDFNTSQWITAALRPPRNKEKRQEQRNRDDAVARRRLRIGRDCLRLFRDVPELRWAWGYGWAWGLIVVTTIAQLAFFKWRKWL